MRILVACEREGKIRRALRERGHDAISCDLEPATDDSPYHHRGNVLDILYDGWDAMIAHPVCRYLANSGSKHLYIGMKKENGRDPDRWAKMVAAADFFKTLLDAPIEHKALENPIMHGHAVALIGRPASQIVQPWWFGHREMKATCWWLEKLPPLLPTAVVGPPPADPEERKSWARVHRMAPGDERTRLRSETYDGIAVACADQWFGEARAAA